MDHVDQRQRYEVWRSISNNSGTATKISSPDVTGTSYDDTTAVVGTTYWYWVKAKNTGGTSDLQRRRLGLSAGHSPGERQLRQPREHQRDGGDPDGHKCERHEGSW